MQILLIEDDAMMGSTLTQGLSDLGLPPTELFHCKEIASLPALLRQHAFDAILCRQYHHQAHEGVRLLHEAHHLGLLAPGCVLLLLEQDEGQVRTEIKAALPELLRAGVVQFLPASE